MTTKPIRYRLGALPGLLPGLMLATVLGMMLLAATPSYAQDLFGEQEMKPPLTEEQKAAGERESIF